MDIDSMRFPMVFYQKGYLFINCPYVSVFFVSRNIDIRGVFQ